MADNNTEGMPALLMQAAQSAAQADGLAPSADGLASSSSQSAGRPNMMSAVTNNADNNAGGGGGKKKGPPLRRGKWTPEEEAYANRLIQEFKAGLLPLTDGTTLRTFLSKLLNCDPMRISKKFVGSNCIGKQVFRRRTADLNRLTPEQIQQSRAELSELERRFLERVAQTNRVKSSGVGAGGTAAVAASQLSANGALVAGLSTAAAAAAGDDDFGTAASLLGGSNNNSNNNNGASANPPWLQPPMGYKPGNGAAFAAANLSTSNSRAAAAGRALLGDFCFKTAGGGSLTGNNNSQNGLSNSSSQHESNAGLLAMAELQRRASRQSLFQNALGQNSTSNLLAAAVQSGGGSSNTLSDLARSVSAARLANFAGGGNSSMNDFVLKNAISREQLSQLAGGDRELSSTGSLSNMVNRQNSFDALMSLDFQSLQSIDNLANLIQDKQQNHGDMKNAVFNQFSSSNNNLAAAPGGSNGNDMSSAAKRLATLGRVETLLRTLSNNNMSSSGESNSNFNLGGLGDSSNLSKLLKTMSGNFNQWNDNQGVNNNNQYASNASAASLLSSSNAQSAVSLANLLRQDSSTGLTALRMQEGLNERNSSVDDFLSLVAAGDIPHQDPNMLNIPFLHQQNNSQQQQMQNPDSNVTAAAAARIIKQQQQQILAQQQLLQATTSNPALANALASRSFGSFQNFTSALAYQNSNSSNNDGGRANNNNGMGAAAGNNNNDSSSSLAMAQARVSSNSDLKRKFKDVGGEGMNGREMKR